MSFKKSFFITKYILLCLVVVSLSSCAGTSKRTSSSYYESDEYFNHLYTTLNYTPKQKRLISVGKESLGTPYVYGGTSPTRGFDCSGFTQYMYKKALDVNLPRTAREQNEIGQYVSRDYLLPGDLVFIDLIGDLSHVGVYIGEGRFFHASTSQNRMMVADMNNPYYSVRYDSSKRVIKY